MYSCSRHPFSRPAAWIVIFAAFSLLRPAMLFPASGMKKFVTENAGFVVYLPDGWTATEKAGGGLLSMEAGNKEKKLSANLSVSGPGSAKDAVEAFQKAFPSLCSPKNKTTFTNSLVSSDRSRLAVSGTFAGIDKAKLEFSAWATREPDGSLVCSLISAPVLMLDQNRQTLLTILTNTRPMKGALSPAKAPGPLPLNEYRMSDGSAVFSIPKGWKVREFGAGCFLAQSADESRSFLVASPEVITPRMGVRPPGVPVSPYLPPHQAMAFLLSFQGIGQVTDFKDVTPRQDVVSQLASNYTAGPVSAEDFTYLVNAGGRRLKAFSFGISFGSRLDTSWRLFHMSVFAPEAEFASLVPTLTLMMQSYRVNDQFAREYIRKGMERARAMQAATSAKIARNAAEIHDMMQQAYDERQKSQDYIDYQRTNYIRGQQDWVSEREGGVVYHTDSWGTQNTATGDYYEGAPYDYVHMTGQNPRHDEQMTPIESRELYERHVK